MELALPKPCKAFVTLGALKNFCVQKGVYMMVDLSRYDVVSYQLRQDGYEFEVYELPSTVLAGAVEEGGKANMIAYISSRVSPEM